MTDQNETFVRDEIGPVDLRAFYVAAKTLLPRAAFNTIMARARETVPPANINHTWPVKLETR